MRIYCGTSGWQYSWNPDGFKWFIKNSGLNAIELNASFYRFPFPSMVTSWANQTKKISPELRWAIKVNRLITHVFKFNEKAFLTWKKFEKLFEPLNEHIDFYLFQLPPSLKSSFAKKLEGFVKRTGLKQRFALEVRNLDWFKAESIDLARNLGITWVSVDAPDFTGFPREVYASNGIVYLRMHGRYDWYSHCYTREELIEVKAKILKSKAEKVYVFFNNDHDMLSNARQMLEVLSQS